MHMIYNRDNNKHIIFYTTLVQHTHPNTMIKQKLVIKWMVCGVRLTLT